jgi:ribonuclease BN (tRNA processing enzyme)
MPRVMAVAEGAAQRSGTRLILLGTQAGPFVNADRAQPANVLIVNGTPYLVDAGNGVARQLSLAHVPLLTIHQIFITHNHDDHNADWGTLMGLAWSLGNTQPITVYGPRGTESMRAGFLQYFAPNAAARYQERATQQPPAAVILAHDITAPGVVYKDANVQVTAVENCHYHFSKGTPGYHWQQSFAFRFDTGDRVVVFSGDTGPCGDVLADFAKDADILVHEVINLPAIEQALRAPIAGGDSSPERHAALMKHLREDHTTPQEVGRTAAKAGVRMVVLSHLAPGRAADPDSDYVDGVREFYSGPVVVAHDLMEF